MKYETSMAALLPVMLVSCGCPETKEDLYDRAWKGDTNAILRVSEIEEQEGKPFGAAGWLGMAAKLGSREALERLKNKAAAGGEGALVVLAEVYRDNGEDDKAAEVAFQLAHEHPQYAFVVGIPFLFPAEGRSADREWGKECLLLAAEHETPATYLLLAELADDDIVPVESERELASWRERGGHATDDEIRLLAINLSGWKACQLTKYQEKWPVRGRDDQ